jgi:AcrR family transcriptional regulator
MATARLTRTDSKTRTRTELIAAARRVFMRRGFHAASLEEIAEEAGFTKGAVYSNFAGKDDLFLAVLDEQYSQRTEAYAKLMLAPEDIAEDIEVMFRAIARFMLDAYAREPAWWSLVSDFSTHAARDPELRERLRATRERFIAAIAQLITSVEERHGIRYRVPATEVARGTGALMRGMTVEWLIDGSAANGEVFEEMLAAYLRGLAEPTH